LIGGNSMSAPEHNGLCSWGLQSVQDSALGRLLQKGVPGAVGSVLGQQAAGMLEWGIRFGMTTLEHGARTIDDGLRHVKLPFMTTHAGEVLRNGVELALRNWHAFLERLERSPQHIDKVICHQVGSANRDAVLKTLSIDATKDYSTYESLGNIGTVSLPLTAAIAEEQGFLQPGHRVGFLGIGSGLNCMMLGVDW
jgi:3-oxoacyl-[acyl-carrier-protein] synthase-3